jgi:hypothetical protein
MVLIFDFAFVKFSFRTIKSCLPSSALKRIGGCFFNLSSGELLLSSNLLCGSKGFFEVYVFFVYEIF